MQLKKVVSFSAIVLSLLSVTHVEAGELKNSDKEMVCGQSAKPMRVTVRHIDPKGIGYNEGYTTVDGFFSLYNGWDKWRLFLDTRLHIFNSGRPALNAGLGTRYVGNSRVWGGNLYYDYRKTHRYHYNQITAGFESLGETWDFRLNGYAPVGRWSSHSYDVGFAKFKGHHALVRQKYEYALGGLNAEAAIHVVPSKNFPLYFAAGPYYLHGRGGTTWGGQGRASVTIYDYLKVEGNVSYDHLFKWIGQGQVGLTFSFGGTKEIRRKGRDCATAMALSERSYQPVDRFEIIATDKVREVSPAINPATGEPYFFTFLSNNSSSLGTFESPYPNLADAEPNSGPYGVIYIFPGDGTTTNMTTGIQLQDYQRLWGSTVAQTLPTKQGVITIPAQSNAGVVNGATVLPIISYPGGSVVTLANGNEVSGLFLQNGAGAANNAIFGEDITNATVLNCTMAGSNAEGHRGIYAIELAGTLVVDNCVFNQTVCGIELTNSTTNLNATVLNSNFGGGAVSDASINWNLSGSSVGNLLAEGNTITSFYSGIYVISSAPFTGTVNNNTITVGTGVGVYFDTTGSQTISLSGNTITGGYTNPCVQLTQSGDLTAILENNEIYATNGGSNLEVDTSGGTSLVTLNNNTLANSYYGYAVYLNHTGGSLTAIGNENTISVQDTYATYSVISDSAITHTLNLTNNTISGEYGWYITQTAGTLSSSWYNNIVAARTTAIDLEDMSAGAVEATFVCSNNTFTGENVLNFSQSIGALSVELDNNKIFSTDEDYGLEWSAGTDATSTKFTVNNNQFNGFYAISGGQSGTGDLTLSIQGNKLSGNQAFVVDLSNSGNDYITISNNTMPGGGYEPAYPVVSIAHSAGTLQQAEITGNTIMGTNTGNPTFLYTSSGTASGSQTISGNTIVSTGTGDAVDLTFGGTGSIQTTLSNNILSANGTNFAVSAFTTAAGFPTLILENNTMTNSGGFNLAANAGSSIWNVNGNTFTASGSTPVAAATSVTGSVCMQLNNNTSYPATSSNYTLQGAGTGTFTYNTPTGNIGGGYAASGTAMEGNCP